METNTKTDDLEIYPYPVKLYEVYKLMFFYEFVFKNPFQIELKDDEGNIEGVDTLKGFTFRRKEIEKILFKGGDPNDPSDAEYVHIAFGHHFGETHPEQPENKNMNHPTIIAFGMDSERAPIINDDVAFDYCDPCPKKCPDWNSERLTVKQSVAYKRLALEFSKS